MSTSCSNSEPFIDMDDSNKESRIWELYGFIGILLVIYSTNIIIKSKPEYVKKLWIGYILIAAILGFMKY